MFEEFCSSNPCSGWRLKGVKSEYKAITVTPEQTLVILKSMTDPLYFTLVFTVAATALRASEVVACDGRTSCGKRTASGSASVGGRGRTASRRRRRPTRPSRSARYLLPYLRAWKDVSPYTADTDFVFPSRTKNGSVPVCASVFVRNHLRPAALAAGVRFPMATASDFTTCATASAIG